MPTLRLQLRAQGTVPDDHQLCCWQTAQRRKQECQPLVVNQTANEEEGTVCSRADISPLPRVDPERDDTQFLLPAL